MPRARKRNTTSNPVPSNMTAKQIRRKKPIDKSYMVPIKPLTDNQTVAFDSYEMGKNLLLHGAAGTGKTYCTGMKAAQLYLKGGYEQIILTRANIPTGRSLGYFPGTVEEKMEPWLKPITNVLKNGLGKGRYEYMDSKDQIIVQPIETIRGNSFDYSIVIVDEAQNLSLEEIKAHL